MSCRATLSDFVLRHKLGSGSYGDVWAVLRKVDQLEYAMKEIDLFGMSKKEQEDCIKEVTVLAILESQYIITYYDSFIEQGKLYIVTEYAAGGTLTDFIKASPARLPEGLIWKLFIQMLLALHHMHSKKILHRDVKTLNVFLTSKDPSAVDVKLGDVGVARILSTQSMAKTIVGTPYYLSPELCEDKPYNAKSDVWALGVVLYECCTRRHPFDADNQGALILKIIRGKYPPVIGYCADMISIIKMCLTQAAAKRPDTDQLLALPIIRQRVLELGIALPLPPQPTSRPTSSGSVLPGKASSTASAVTSGKLRAGGVPAAGASAAAKKGGRVMASKAPPSSNAKRPASASQAEKKQEELLAAGRKGVIHVPGDMDQPTPAAEPSPQGDTTPPAMPTATTAANDISFRFGSTAPSSRPVEDHAAFEAAAAAAGSVDVRVVALESTEGEMAPQASAEPLQPLQMSWTISDSGLGERLEGTAKAAPGGAAGGPPAEERRGTSSGLGHVNPGEDRQTEATVLENVATDEGARMRGSRRGGPSAPTGGEEEAQEEQEEGEEEQEEDEEEEQFNPAECANTVKQLRDSCISMIGEQAFERLYKLLQAESEEGAAEDCANSLSKKVWGIIPSEQSSVVPLLYRIMYLRSRLDAAA